MAGLRTAFPQTSATELWAQGRQARHLHFQQLSVAWHSEIRSTAQPHVPFLRLSVRQGATRCRFEISGRRTAFSQSGVHHMTADFYLQKHTGMAWIVRDGTHWHTTATTSAIPKSCLPCHDVAACTTKQQQRFHIVCVDLFVRH